MLLYQMKEEQKKALKLTDLPPHLQRKYNKSQVFGKERQVNIMRFDFDVKQLRERQAEKQKTIEEKLEQFKIDTTEQKYLSKVFNYLSSSNSGTYFTETEVRGVLRLLGSKITKKQIERMIWEFDDDLNKRITQREFFNMYKRCTIDRTAAENKNLFNLTQFLMYCRPAHFRITVEDTLQLLFVRAKVDLERQGLRAEQKDVINKLQEEIQVIFAGEEKTPEGLQKQITFEQYLERINKRAIEKRKQQIAKAKSALKYGTRIKNENQ